MAIYNVEGYGQIELPDSIKSEDIDDAIDKYISINKFNSANGPGQQQPQIQNVGPAEPSMSVSLGYINDQQTPVEQSQANQTQQPDEISALANFLSQAAQSPASQFVLGAGDQFNNAFRNIGNMILPKGMQAPQVHHGKGTPYEVGKIAGDIGSFATTGGALRNALTAAESLPMIGKLAAKIGGSEAPGVIGAPLSASAPSAFSTAIGGPGAVARRAAGAGLYGATQEEDNRLGGAAGMAGSSGLMDALTGGAFKLMPRNFLAGGLPTEKLIENLALSKGFGTPLGNIVGSPKLKALSEDILPNLPWSGGKEARTKIQNQIEQKGMGIIDNLRHNIPTKDVSKEIVNELKGSHIAAEKTNTASYSAANDTADAHGFHIKAGELSEVAKKYGQEIKDKKFLEYYPETRKIVRLLHTLSKDIYKPVKKVNPNELSKEERDFRHTLTPKQNMELLISEKLLRGNEKSKKIAPKELEELSLADANTMAARILKTAKDLSLIHGEKARNESNALYEIGRAFKNDVKGQVNKSGIPKLIEQFNLAEKHYGETYAPYLEKQIQKFTSGKEPASSITSNFIKTTKNDDKSELITQIMHSLPQKGKDLLKYSYLSRALEDGKLNPIKMKELLSREKLGENQISSLFNNPAELKSINDYTKLASLNSNAMERMFKSKSESGKTHLLTSLVHKMYLLPTLAAAAGGAAGFGALGAIAGGSSALATGNILQKVLSSEKVREKVVNALIKDAENPKRNIFKKTKTILTPLIDSAVRKGIENNENY